MFYSLLLITFILYGYITWKNSKWGVYLICALLPTYLIRFEILGLPLTLLEVMIWLLFVIWLIKLKYNPWQALKGIFNKERRYNAVPKILHWPAIIFLLASALAVFVSPDLNAALGIWKAYFIEALLFFLVFVYTIKTDTEIRNVIKALGLTALAIGIFALIQKLTGALIDNPFWQAEATRRITTIFGYPNANALFAAPVLILTITNWFKEKKSWWLLFNSVVIIFSFLTILWAKSAGGILAVGLGILAALIIYKKTRLATLVVILLFSIFSFFSPAIKTFIKQSYIDSKQIYLNDAPTDLQLRTSQWHESLQMLKDRPWLGAGLAGYQETVKPYHLNRHVEIFLYPHNLILNFWSEIGLLGLVSFIWIVVVFFLILAKNKTADLCLKITLISAMIALLAHGLVDAPYFKNDLSILFWVIVGMAVILKNQKKLKVNSFSHR